MSERRRRQELLERLERIEIELAEMRELVIAMAMLQEELARRLGEAAETDGDDLLTRMLH